MRLIETQSKETLSYWAIDYCQQVILPLWCKYYPMINVPQNTLNAASEWLLGAVKLPKEKLVKLGHSGH